MLRFSLLAFLACVSLRVHAQDDFIPQEASDAAVEAETQDAIEAEFSDEEDQPVKPVPPSKPAIVETTPVPDVQKKSSASGEKIFDWSKHQGEKEVAHPFAEKGLIRITKNREYIYRVDSSEQKNAYSFRIGMFNPVNLKNPNAERSATFEDNYDQTDNPSLAVDYEWQMWKSPIGKFGLRGSGGFYVAQGNGHFESAENADLTPREVFTFWTLPVSAGAIYRMQFWDKQLFVPYGEGGLVLFPFGELRDDDKAPKWGGAAGAYFAGGVAFNLTYFDAMAAIQMDREYGINRVYLTAEYRAVVGLTTYDFSSDLINGGLLMEY